MKIISMVQEKGGVGKTTLATHIAAGLATRGARVLLVDADGQAHATRVFGLAPMPCLYNVLVRGAKWYEDKGQQSDVLHVADPARYAPGSKAEGALVLLPGNVETMVIPLAVSDPFLLYRRLAELREAFDVCVIDTSPTPSLLNGSIMLASDHVILPAEMEYFSLKALENTLLNTRTFAAERQARGLPALTTLGVIPTMYRASTVEHSENLSQFVKQHGDLVWEAVAQRVTWPEAAMKRQSVFVYAPGSPAAAEGWRVVDRVQEAIA